MDCCEIKDVLYSKDDEDLYGFLIFDNVSFEELSEKIETIISQFQEEEFEWIIDDILINLPASWDVVFKEHKHCVYI